jgi:hypothetical protein
LPRSWVSQSSASRVAVSSICAAPFSSTCSTQSDNNSRKSRLRCSWQFPWCALARTVQLQSLSQYFWAFWPCFSVDLSRNPDATYTSNTSCIFWNMPTCSVAEVHRCFGVTYGFDFHGLRIRSFTRLHGIKFHEILFFIVTFVRTSNPTVTILCLQIITRQHCFPFHISLETWENNFTNILYCVDPLLDNDLETNNETIFVVWQQILNKQVYAAVTG